MKKFFSFLLIIFIIINISAKSFAVNDIYTIDNNYSKIENSFALTTINVETDENNNSKNPIISMLLSFFIPGAGQVYNEEYLKGALLFTGISTLIILTFFVIEPKKASLEKEKQVNSLIELSSLISKVGIPVLWVYGWGSAYQSLDPEYLKKLEKEKKDEEKKKLNNGISNNLIQINLFSYNF